LLASPPDHLITAKGGGGLIVEAALALAGVPCQVGDVAWDCLDAIASRCEALPAVARAFARNRAE
jgi:hypothetical protein